jgi:3-oxoacyl-[acyl-carrier-protein] synthase-3
MAFLEFPNLRIAGISAGVPKTIVKTRSRNPDYSDEAYIKSVGVEEKRLDDAFTTSDLCYAAAEQLISDLQWNKGDIEAIIFVSQYRDYILPATAPILQDRLNLSKECYAADVSLGCSGWTYGLSVISGLMSNGSIKKALLMVGDARGITPLSATSDPLFGFAGCVTAVEYVESSEGFYFHVGSDGSGYKVIIIPDGGARNGFSADSLVMFKSEDGIVRNKLDGVMDGMDVFSFAISTVPKSIKKLAERHDIDLSAVDYLVLHQANKKINDMIAKKLKFEEERVLNSLSHFGNTSSASIPMSIVANTTTDMFKEKKTFITCGFGVGLSWGSAYFELKDCIISKLVEV